MHPALVLALIVGVVLKLLHFPYHTVLLLVVVALGIGTSIPNLRNTRNLKPGAVWLSGPGCCTLWRY